MGCDNNCTAWWFGENQVYKADPDIAGPGILAVFIASSTIALSLSLAHIMLTPTASPDRNVIDFWVPRVVPLMCDIVKNPNSARQSIDERKAHVPQLPTIVKRRNEKVAKTIEKVILSLSDQLLLTGTAVLIASFWTHCSISVYHFAISSDLAWFASNVHIITIDVLLQYLQDPNRAVLRDSRAILMSCMAIFLAASTIMQGHRYWYMSWPYDAQCVFNDLIFRNVGGKPARWMYANLAFIVIGYPPSIASLYETPGEFVEKWLCDKPKAASERLIRSCKSNRDGITTQSTRMAHARYLLYYLLVACAKMCVKCYIFLYRILTTLNGSRWFNLIFNLAWFGQGLASIFGDRNIPVGDMDGTENAMTFGQIVPILLLSSTLLVAMEAYDDVKIDMRKEDLSQGDHSTTSLVHTRSSSTQSPPTSQSFEMSGALQASDDHLDRVPSSIWQVDTEAEHRSQSSGIDDVRPISAILKRPTWPNYGVAAPETNRTSSSLREEINPRQDH